MISLSLINAEKLEEGLKSLIQESDPYKDALVQKWLMHYAHSRVINFSTLIILS